MSLFENFPYTNLHELNLDWIIQELDRIKDSAVISVNGETGDVILYTDPDIEFPSTDNGGWDMIRKVDGTIAAGIRFTADGIAYLITGPQVRQLYDANHQPPYPVTSVNGLTGDITLYTDQYIRLPDLTDEQMLNWNIYRYVNNVLHGIQFDNNGKAYVMNGSARYQIYTEHDAQNAIIVNDPSAGVMNVSSTAPGGNWGLLRETDSGVAGIVFSYDTDDAVAYLRYTKEVGGQTITNSVKLLTPSDIPSSSGVVSINGLTGVVTLNGSNLVYKAGTQTNIANIIDDMLADATNMKSCLAIVETGNTATHNINSGSYVVWQGLLYTARNNIANGDALSSTNLEAVTNGGLNSLKEVIANKANLTNFGAIAKQASMSINLNNQACLLLMAFASSSSRCGMWMVFCNSASSNSQAISINNGSDIAVTTGTGSITIANNSTSLATNIYGIIINGTAVLQI